MIVKMTHLNLNDYNKANDGFMVIGRIIPKYENNTWTYTEETFSDPYFKKYDNDQIDVSYTKEKGKAVFLYYRDHQCIGQIRLRSNWNGYAFVEDIGVRRDWRQQGIAKELLEKATEWAKQNSFAGLMLETQDINVAACRFYAKNNLVIGAVDNMLYSNFPTANEIAVFWYKKF